MKKLFKIFHKSGMSAREAYLIGRILANAENITELLKRLEQMPKVSREDIYLQTFLVVKHLPADSIMTEGY